jgi:Ca2+-transporting ATPase
MGITGTEVTKDAAEMILTDDNFATIVSAVRGGRALYDNLMKYIRLQMICVGAFILTFLGAGIFNIANGAPLAPLQILWINFAIDVVLAIGLGFDAETPGLMSRRPRPPAEPVIPLGLGIWLGASGLMIATGVLIIVAWAEAAYGLQVATTAGLAATSLLHIAAALVWRDSYHTIFTRETIANGRFNMLVLAALGLTVVVTIVDGLNRIFDTVPLTAQQWGVCLLAVVAYLVLSEVLKLVVRKTNRAGAL